MMTVAIESERLLLREYAEEDWSAVHVYASDPEVSAFMLWGPNCEDETRAFIKLARMFASENPRNNYELAVMLKEQGILIGGCAIRIRDWEHKEGELGYCFNKNYWGNGYATEAARAVVAFGFRELALHRIFATADSQNIASQRVLERVGMQKEGYLHQNKFIKGQWRDSLLYAVVCGEWVR